MGKKCCVPYCYSGYNKYNERYPMYGVPKNDFFLKKWQDAIARADRQITPNDSVCQRHFIPDDFCYRRLVRGEVEEYKVPKLKPDAIPSVFPQTPEYIIGTVKKRRKHDIQPDVKVDDFLDVEKQSVDSRSVDGVRSTRNNGAIMVCDTILNEEIDIKLELNDEEEVEADSNLEDYVGPKKYKCHLCNYRSKWQGNVQNHQHVHLEGDQYYFKCDSCKTFRTKWFSSYKSHMRTKHGMDTKKVFVCEICQYNASSKEILKMHAMRKHRNATFQTIKQEKEIVRQPSFKCDICLFECDVKHTFLEHILMHRGISIEKVNK